MTKKLLKSHIMTNQKLSIYFCKAECLFISLLAVRQHPKHTFTHITPEKTDSNRHRDTQHYTHSPFQRLRHQMTSEFDVNKKCDWLLLTEIFEHFDWLDPVTIMNPSISRLRSDPRV